MHEEHAEHVAEVRQEHQQTLARQKKELEDTFEEKEEEFAMQMIGSVQCDAVCLF